MARPEGVGLSRAQGSSPQSPVMPWGGALAPTGDCSMTPTPTEPGTYVLVIDRAVFRQVSAKDIDVIQDAMENGLASVTFRTNGEIVQTLIEGVSIGWARERYPSSQAPALGGQTIRPGSEAPPGPSSTAAVR